MQLLSIDGRIEVIGIANDGVQAVSLAKELQPDVILMDVKMPVCDGIEAIGRLRDAGVRVPVMILTGANDSVDAEEALRAGASAFFRKEEGIDELRKVFFEVASLTAVLGHSMPA